MSLDYHLERVVGDSVEVEQAESLLTKCIDCAPSPGSPS